MIRKYRSIFVALLAGFGLLALISVTANSILLPKLLAAVESAAVQSHVDLQIQRAQVSWFPLGLRLTDVKAERRGLFKLSMAHSLFGLRFPSLLHPRLELDVTLENGRMRYMVAPSSPAKGSAQEATSPPSLERSGLWAFGSRVHFRNVEFEILRSGKSSWLFAVGDLEMAKERLTDPATPLSVHLQGQLGPPGFEWPYSISAPEVFVTDKEVHGSGVEISVAGISSSWRFSAGTDLKQYDLAGGLSVDDFAKLPRTTFPPFIKDLRGSAKATVMASNRNDEDTVAEAQFTAQNMAMDMNWRDGDRQIKGVVKVDFQTDLAFHQNQVQVRRFEGHVDLAQADIHVPPVFTKTFNEELKWDVSASGDEHHIRIRQSDLHVGHAAILANGDVADILTEPQSAIEGRLMGVPSMQFALAVQTQGLKTFALRADWRSSDLSRLADFYPPLKAYSLTGSAHVVAAVSGPLQKPSDWKEWPLLSQVTVSAHLPEVDVADRPPAKMPGNLRKPPGRGETETFELAQHPIFKGLHLGSQLTIDHLHFRDLNVDGIEIKASVADGAVLGHGKVARLLDAVLVSPQFHIQPFQRNGFLSADLNVDHLNVEKALRFVRPDSAPAFSGTLSGRARVTTEDPRRPEFLNSVFADGRMKVTSLKMNALPLEDKADDVLSRIPGVGTHSLDGLKGSTFVADTTFQLNHRVAKLNPFLAVSNRNDELHLQGTVDLAMMAHLKGDFLLTHPPVKGDFLKANQDRQGRLDLPLEIDGSLINPNIQFLASTVDQMVGKMLEYEKKQLFQKAGDQLQDEIKKRLKGIFGQ